MKIAILVANLAINGGTQRQALELANYLSRQGNEVKVYCVHLDVDLCYPELMKNIKVYGLFEKRKTLSLNIFYHFLNLFPPQLFLKKISNELVNLMDDNFDIVHPHDHTVYGAAYCYKNRYGCSTIWMMNDLPGVVTKNKVSIRAEDNIFRYMFKKIKYYLRNLIRPPHLKAILDMDKVVVLDVRNKKLVKDNLGIDAKIIRSGLDIKQFKYKRRSISNGGEIKILTVGIFFPYRRFEDLIEALKYLIDDDYQINLTIIGFEKSNQIYAKKIHNLVEKLNVSDYVAFMGGVSGEELIREYSNSDIFVFPNYPQTWGLAVFEAMACGTPVIVSKGAGASEVLTDGENALLVNPESPKEIADRIEQLITNEKIWRKLSINGRNFVEKNISWEIYGENMLKLFKEVIDGKS